MLHFINCLSIRSLALAGVVALFGMSATPASAGYPSNSGNSYQSGYGSSFSDEYAHRPSYYFKDVVVYQPRQVPDVQWVTKYDHCGKPIQVKVVTYRTIQVPVHQRIKVAY